MNHVKLLYIKKHVQTMNGNSGVVGSFQSVVLTQISEPALAAVCGRREVIVPFQGQCSASRLLIVATIFADRPPAYHLTVDIRKLVNKNSILTSSTRYQCSTLFLFTKIHIPREKRFASVDCKNNNHVIASSFRFYLRLNLFICATIDSCRWPSFSL